MNIKTLLICFCMIKFITFGGPTINYHERVSKLCIEAINPNFFSEIIGLTDTDL